MVFYLLFITLNILIARGFIVVVCTDFRKFEHLSLDLLNVSKFVEMHGSKRDVSITSLDLPVETKTIRDLKECFEVLRQLVWSILFLPLG